MSLILEQNLEARKSDIIIMIIIIINSSRSLVAIWFPYCNTILPTLLLQFFFYFLVY